MPIYEYACRSCEHQFETIQKVSDPPPGDCPACGETALRKLVSAPVFRLKGNGWYETDFKNANRKNVSDNGGSEGNGETQGDGKSAAASGSADTAAGKDTQATKDKGSKTPDSKTTSSTGTSSAAKAD